MSGKSASLQKPNMLGLLGVVRPRGFTRDLSVDHHLSNNYTKTFRLNNGNDIDEPK